MEKQGTCIFQVSLSENVIDFNEIIRPETPVEVEIGCGNGHFLVARALKNPETHYIGIERMMDRVRKVDKKVTANGLTNLTVLRAEAGRCFSKLFPENRLRAVYLFFPDPWPKRRHHKNRLFSETFSSDLFRCLKPSGEIHIATDHEDYYHQMYRFLATDPRFSEIPSLERDENEKTCFERLFLSQGKPIHACSFRRKP